MSPDHKSAFCARLKARKSLLIFHLLESSRLPQVLVLGFTSHIYIYKGIEKNCTPFGETALVSIKYLQAEWNAINENGIKETKCVFST